jgi:PAS domain S-box-containing protein
MSGADPRELLGSFKGWLHTQPRRYGFALISVIVATLLRYVLGAAFGLTLPFLLFYPAILMVALAAGFGPALFATLLSAASGAYFFYPQIAMIVTTRIAAVYWLILFAGVGTVLTTLGELIRRHHYQKLQFEKVVEGLDQMAFVVDREYRYVVANRAYLERRGTTREQVIGRPMNQILDPGVFEAEVKERIDECFRGKIVQFEMRYRYPALGDRDLFVSYFPIEGPNGVERVACVFQDTSERKRAERSLTLFRTLVDQSNDAVELVDTETLRFLDFNEKACKDLGYTRDEMFSLTVLDINPTLDEAKRANVLRRLRESQFVVQQGTHRRKDGSTFPVEVSLGLVQPEGRYIVAVARDISDRKKAEDALRESEDRYRDLVEHSEDLLCTHDLEGNLLSVNPAPARILGYSVEELLKIPMRDLIVPGSRELFEQYLERFRTTGEPQSGLLCVITRDGEIRTWEYHNTLRTDSVAKPIVRGIAHDITEQRRAELALRASEQRYRMLFEQNIAGVAISGTDGLLVDCNVAWARMLGYDSPDEVRGRQTSEFYFNLADRNPLLEELERTGVCLNRELQLQRKDGTGVWVLFDCCLRQAESGPPVLQAAAFDITERKRAEDALRLREEDYRRFVERSSEGIFRQDLERPLSVNLPEDEMVQRILRESHLAECNDALARMYGFGSAQELIGKPLTETVSPDDPRNIELTREYIRSGFRVLGRESHEMDAHGHAKIFLNSMIGIVENGELLRTWGIQRDVTERVRAEAARKNAEDALQASEAHFRTLSERFRVALKNSPVAVFSQDRDLRYTWVDNSALLSGDEILGKTDEEILGPDKARRLRELKQKVLETGVGVREEVVISRNGTISAFDITLEPIFDSARHVVGITGAAMDIARLRALADGLQETRDRLATEKSYLESEIKKELGFEEIIGQSSSLREVLKKARVVARTDSTVLLLGETGTGKELVARSVHALSGRHARNFIKLNCAAVPSGLLESELFGHEKGAFTGAVNQKVGRLELADKGTLFLDEIGELPLELQPKLLRVLQDREFERLGGVRTVRVDVRIISATNRDLKRDVAAKRFREDLFYRLNVFPIELPPLRERRSDIPILVHHFLRKHAARMSKHIESIPDETMEVLQNWNWPGNIRELENVIERMVILSNGDVLADPPAELESLQEVPEDNLTGIERDHIIRILRETNGMLSGPDGAASRLGVKRTTLQSMLKRFNIDLQHYRRGTGTFGPG